MDDCHRSTAVPYRIGEDCLDRVLRRQQPSVLVRWVQRLVSPGLARPRNAQSRIAPRLELLTVDC